MDSVGTVTRITEGIYSRDNHGFSFYSLADGTCWVVWSAYGPEGSRSFARHVGGTGPGDIYSLGKSDTSQVCPRCVPGDIPTIVWLEAEDDTYSVCSRDVVEGELTPPRTVCRLPKRAKPGGLQAIRTENGALWVAWAQSEVRSSTIEILQLSPDRKTVSLSLTAGTRRDYRPRLVAVGASDVHLVWDAYVDGTYDVYGCPVRDSGPGPVEQISRGAEWAVNACVCRDSSGQLRCVWVRWQDVIWKQSVIHQKFSLRGARSDGGDWAPWGACDGIPDIAPLHYGLLTDFDRKPPALGHQGRRLHPMLRSSSDGSVWLFYESKQDDAVQTLGSRGRLVGLRYAQNMWSEPLCVTEGRVYYDLPENELLDSSIPLVARSIDAADPETPVDELVLQRVPLSADLPSVPDDRIVVDLTHWREIDLPLPGLDRGALERTQLPGQAHGEFRLIWGDFHVHGEGSVECDGDLDQIAHYARDKGGLHALTISDNDHFWSPMVRGNQRWLTDFEWDANLGNAKVINEPGVFALFPGYEQTIGADSPSIVGRRLLRNHTSVMADDDDMERDLLHFTPAVRNARLDGRRSSCKDVVECVKWAKEKGYYPLPHAHSNWWRLVDPAVQTACDVMVAWMRNIEVFDIYHTYLNQGKMFGFTGSSDSHYRNPGLGGAVTGLWVTELSRAGVLEALRARRTYATAGQRIIIEFTVNDTFMGGSLVVAEDPVLRWRVAGEENDSYTLRVLRDGRPMHEETFTGSSQGDVLDRDLFIHRPGEHYYYLEVVSSTSIPDYTSNAAHALGGRAWSTPVWLETADWIVG